MAKQKAASDIIDFVSGTQQIIADYKADCQTMTETLKDEYNEAADKFMDVAPEIKDAYEQVQTAGHEYATEMLARADQMVADVNALYKQIYPEGNPGTPDTVLPPTEEA